MEGRFNPVRSSKGAYRAPSWSWASVDGEIDYLCSYAYSRDGYTTRLMAEVTNITVSTHEADIKNTGRVYGASCTIRGKLASLMNFSSDKSAAIPDGEATFEWRFTWDSLKLIPDTLEPWPPQKEIFLIPIYETIGTGGYVHNYSIDGLIVQPKKKWSNASANRRFHTWLL
jgi:hypothetical protein